MMLRKTAFALAAATVAMTAQPALAERVLRLDEVAVGELDPAKATDFADSMLMFNVYDTLVLANQGGPGIQPHLAESWTIDGNSYTFTLRDDVTFHSGNPVAAADVVFSFDRMVALGQGFSYLFSQRVASVEAVDDRTVVFTLTDTYAPFLASLTRLPIVDAALVRDNLGEGDGEMGDWGQAFLSANGAGSGAYRVDRHNPQEETVMSAFDGYFLPFAENHPETVRVRYGLEAPTVRTLMARGEHDIASQWLPPEVVQALDASDDVQLFSESGTGGFYIKLNTTRPPLDDVHCRRALVHALDYQAMLSLIAINDEVSQGSPSTGAIPVGMMGANDAGSPLMRDMDAAREALDQCAHAAGDHTLEVSWIAEVPLEERFALLMQANFSELGFNAEIQRIPWALFTEQVSRPETTPHISQLFINAVTPDPDTLLYNMYHSSVAGTWQSPEYLNDAEVDALLEAGRTETDPAARAEIYAQLNDRLMALAATIYGYDRKSVYAASTRVTAPALSDPAEAFSLDGMGFTFRLMSIAE